MQDLVHSISQEDFDHLILSEDAVEVIRLVSGYISRSLSKNIDCEACKIALSNESVTSAYIDEQNKGSF